MPRDLAALLRRHGIQPSAQRMAVAEFALFTDAHPSAEQVFRQAKRRLSVLSRATVYNTLNLFVERGLLRAFALGEGRVVFDPKLRRHHHFIDEPTGRIYDVPWEALDVSKLDSLRAFEVREYQVVLRGRKRAAPRRKT